MHTLYDFITHVKGIEYLLSVSSIVIFILFWEILKPAPFRSIANTGKQELEFFRQNGLVSVFRSIGKIAAAPFIGLAYIAIVPVGFLVAMALGAAGLVLKGVTGVLGLLGANVSFEWRPMEAYFSGRKGKKKDKAGN